MNTVDIIHIDDDQKITSLFERFSERLDLQYLSCAHLQALTEVLNNTRARIYLVDGRFPMVQGANEEYLAPSAVGNIRTTAGGDARIILVSGEGQIESYAEQLQIEYMHKGSQSVQDMLKAVKVMIEKSNEG